MVDQRTGMWYPDYYGQQPWQDSAYIRATSQMSVPPQQGTQQQNPQMMTPPTIRAEIIQVESQDAIDRCQQNPGTAMYMTKDEQLIVIRTKLENGEHSDVMYDKRPPAPPEPKINPADYVRRDELASLISEMIHAEEEKNGTV